MKNRKTGWKCSKLIYKAGLYREMQLFLIAGKENYKNKAFGTEDSKIIYTRYF